jgi:hypothetical protein
MTTAFSFGKRVIYNSEKNWVMVYAENGISEGHEDMLKAHYNVDHITIVLREWNK